MEKLEWCMNRKRGLKKTEENRNLAAEYIETAEESLRVLENIKETKSNIWLATTKYYIEYFAVYALLMRAGIKSEIHDCTIEFAGWLEKAGFIPKGTVKMLESDKELRIDNQYYLKNRDVKINMKSLRNFVLEMKRRIDCLTDEDIRRIRMFFD